MDTALIKKTYKGWFKSHRNIAEWEHYKEGNTFRVFFHCLVSASYLPFEFHGKTFPAGTVNKTLKQFSEELDLPIQVIRTALGKLQKTGELTQLKCGKSALYKVNNWEFYQDSTQFEKNNTIFNTIFNTNKEAKRALNKADLDNYPENSTQFLTQFSTLLKEDNKEINNNSSFSNENNAPSKKKKSNQNDSKEREIIDYFNEATGKRNGYTDSKTKAIRAILKMGYSFDDCKKVIDVKAKEWPKGKTWNDGTEPYKQYLNIETLFRKSKFEKYHEQALENETTSQPQQMNQRFNSTEEYENYLNDLSDLDGLGF
jgi:uncharacterized phage protein (TIGR02220 family)